MGRLIGVLVLVAAAGSTATAVVTVTRTAAIRYVADFELALFEDLEQAL